VRVTILFACAMCIALAGCGEKAVRPVEGGNAKLGKRLVEQYQCTSCHAIPGAAGASSDAGPPLEGFGKRSYIAGSIPNLAPNLVQWLVNPPAMKPGTMMPNLGVSEAEARHMAAYLYNAE
jgi:cytochrome c